MQAGACPDTFNMPVPEYSSPFLQKASVLKSRQTFTHFVVMEREKSHMLQVDTDMRMLSTYAVVILYFSDLLVRTFKVKNRIAIFMH